MVFSSSPVPRRCPLPENLVACPDCDLLQRLPSLPAGGTAHCTRCGRTLATSRPGSIERTLALTVSAAILFLVANVFPLMSLSASGLTSSTTILGGARQMWTEGRQDAAVLVGLFAVIAPALQVAFLSTVLFAARRAPAPAWIGELLHCSETFRSWSMVEVMVLGLLVALVKISTLATVTPGLGIFAAGAFVVVSVAAAASFDPGEVWSRVRWADGTWPGRTPPPGGIGAPEAGR